MNCIKLFIVLKMRLKILLNKIQEENRIDYKNK